MYCVPTWERALELSRLQDIRTDLEDQGVTGGALDMVKGLIDVITFERDELYIEQTYGKDKEIYLYIMSGYHWLRDSET